MIRVTSSIEHVRTGALSIWMKVARGRVRPATAYFTVLDRNAGWLALAGSLILVFALYGRALGFSFLFDDTFDLTRVEGRSYWQLLTSSEGYSYYRPIPFLIWKFLREIQGYYDPAVLHALPLIAHAVAGWCLFLVVRRLGAGLWAIFPALLFLTYPFHYQNIAVVGTLFHPLTGAAMLGALVLYERARSVSIASQGMNVDVSPPQVNAGTRWDSMRAVLWDRDRRRATLLHVSALLATVLALWSHESGVTVAVLIVIVELVLLWRLRTRRPSLWLAGHLLAVLLFVVAWSVVEKAPFTDRTSLDELQPKGLFFLQGFFWPLTAQTAWIRDNIGVPGGITIATIGLLDLAVAALVAVVAAYALAAWRTRRFELLAIPVIGLMIGMAASAPALWRLSWAYVENSPRLLYLVAFGASIFWGLLPALSFADDRFTRIWRCVTIALALLIVAQSWRFIDVRMEMLETGTATIDEIVALGERYDGQSILVINAPSWFAQGSYEYPYGHFGVQLMPSYIGLDRVIYTSSRRSTEVAANSGTFEADTSAGPYPFGPHGPVLTIEQLDTLLRDGATVITVWPTNSNYSVREVGRLRSGMADRDLVGAGQIDGTFQVSPARVAVVDGQLTIYFDMHVLESIELDVEIVVELRAADDAIVASSTGYSIAGLSPPSLWQAGDLIEDSVAMSIPPAGRYTIQIGMQPVGTTERLPTTDPNGDAIGDGMLLVGVIDVSDDRVTVAGSPP